jgi:ABC-2 type transport system permease protein
MNAALLRSMMKTNAQTIFSYAFGMVFYLCLVLWVYPSIASSSALNTVLKTMPQSMLKVFGLQAGIQQVGDYLSGEFYGLIYVIIMAVFTLTTASKLVAHLVDRGPMAYLLASPVSRVRVAWTQAVVLLTGMFIISVFTTIGGWLGAAWLVKHQHLDIGPFVQMNLIGFLLFAVVSGYSFLCSCAFNDEKKALGTSATITLVFYGLNLVGKLSDKVAWMKNLSVFTAFDAQGILHGHVHVIQTALGLAVGAAILFIAGVLVFRQRELPL